jgi:mxaJ protein
MLPITSKREFNMTKTNIIAQSAMTILGLSFLTSASVMAASNTETLRVCAASNELPYSSQSKDGFENKLAEVLAENMGRKLEYVWSDKAAIFLVSEHLLKNQCDVVMGVDNDDPRVATSTPYYTSGYAFIYRKDAGVKVDNWQSDALKDMTKFAVVPGSPSEVMLREIGKYEGNFNYTMSLIGFKSRRNQYVRYAPDKLVSEVASGKADIAHIWAPEAARYVANSSVPLEMVVGEKIAQTGEGEGVKQYFQQSIAVRPDDTELLKEINTVLNQESSKFEAVLKQEGVPLL